MRSFFETPVLNKGQRSWVITLEILPNRSLAKGQSTQCTHSQSQRTLCPALLGVAKTPGYHWVSPVPGSSWDFITVEDSRVDAALWPRLPLGPL